MPVNSFVAILVHAVPRFRRTRVFVTIHPDWCDHMAALGLRSADDFLNHPGEIVSGHPDRHVMRTTFGSASVYLKREHRVPWKDRLSSWRAGFGFASVSCREAATLRVLSAAGIPVPEWIAVGEDGHGRAFLALKSVDGATDLRRHAPALARQPSRQRRTLARRLGRLIAAVHDAGIVYPDLYAKHILIDPNGEITLLDWQRSQIPCRLSWRTRCRDLAALHASLADELAAPADRIAFLLAYRRATGQAPSFGTLCRMIEKRTATLLRRSSIREQRLPAVRDSQPLVWVDGEAVAVTPLGRAALSDDDLTKLGYALPTDRTGVCETQRLNLPDGRSAELIRRRTVRRLSLLRDIVRGRRWAAPESRDAADLLRRERLGEPARLLAFGQREIAWGIVESFLLRLTDDERRGG